MPEQREKRDFLRMKSSILLYKFIVNYDTGSTVMPTSVALPSDGENMVLMLDLKPLGQQSAVLPNLAENYRLHA